MVDIDGYDEIEELDKEETCLCNTKKRNIVMVYVCVHEYICVLNWI